MPDSNIDPELLPAVNKLKELLGDSACFDLNDLAAARSFSAAMSEAGIAASPVRQNVKIDRTVIHDDELGIDVELQIYQNKSHKQKQPGILFIHGGGYVLGAAHHAQTRLSKWCDELGVTIASVEYRLAPENPFPAGLHDCYAALKWLHNNDGNLNIDTQRLAIVGDSAGGGLAAGLAQYVRDHSDIKVSFQLLMWPMLDHTNIKPADPAKPQKLLWNQANNEFGWRAYLGSGVSDDLLAYASPSTASDLANLPKAFVLIGDQDLFYQESCQFADQLKDCGVEVALNTYPGGFHGFAVVNPNAAISQKFDNDVSMILTNGFS